MCETMFFFQCSGMCQPLDSATPGRPPNVPFFGRERYVFMFYVKKIVPVDMASGPQDRGYSTLVFGYLSIL
jgi:hypothetical protein